MESSQDDYQRILRRHQREKKELQAHIVVMKSEIPKTEKRKRKQLLLEVDRLEAELDQKHQQELEKFQELFPDNRGLSSVTEDLAKMNLENQPPRVLKARKRRERRRALERELQESAAEAQRENLASYCRDEEKQLAMILAARNLELKDVPADGHCMYRAIQDQLPFSVTVEGLRSHTADYMRKHIDDFLPFFSAAETGVAYSRDDFLCYCDGIVSNGTWGGQMELRALSHILKTPIEVIQVDSPVFVIGEEYTKKPITLVYMHFACYLGGHYSSVKPLEAGAVGGAAPRFF